MSAAQPILYGVFRALLDRNVALGVPDYLDAVRALQNGFGLSRDQSEAPRLVDVRWLCEALWARNDAEIHLIRALFHCIEPAKPEEIHAVRDWLGLTPPQAPGPEEPDERVPGERPVRSGEPSAAAKTVHPDSQASDEKRLRIGLEAADLQEGWRLPSQRIELPVPEPFALHPETAMSLRALTVTWRRLRSLLRSGPKIELDTDATIASRCRFGVLARPVMRAPRVNRARLVVLSDVSASMAPWRPFLDLVERSLKLGRLQSPQMYYFANLQRTAVFADPGLRKTVHIEEIMRRSLGAGLLILSDAGAARRFLNYRRAERTERFLRRIAPHFRAIVWINPMPRQRWENTTAERIEGISYANMLPLTPQSMSRAIDILRGAKSR